MNLTNVEKRTVLVVFDELAKMPYSKLNTFLGSITIKEMLRLRTKLEFEGYCERHNIRFEDMTDENFEDAALEQAERDGYAV